MEFLWLRKRAAQLNKEIQAAGLVKLTFGNASIRDPTTKAIAIKPSGVDFHHLDEDSMVVLNLEGDILFGEKKPSSDLQTHLELYRSFQGINAIIHTHSEYATSFAQARTQIKPYGTTHADHFFGAVPVSQELSPKDIRTEYERKTGREIVKTFERLGISYLEVPACLVADHGPFVWGATPQQSLENAIVLEEVAKMNFKTSLINPKKRPISIALLEKHYYRKNGKNAYYGQD